MARYKIFTSNVIILQRCLMALLAFLCSCNDAGDTEEKPVSTVDSNVAIPPDPNLPYLYLDSHRVDTSFPVAMDSAGATVNAEDTGYKP